MKLNRLIQDVEVSETHGGSEVEISAVTFDSRKVKPGTLFIAITGTIADGHAYIEKAVAKGAVAIVCEKLPETMDPGVAFSLTPDSRKALAIIAAEWYGHPSREISLVGITGTNGKTTIATLLYKVNTGLGYKAGILTTIEVIINGKRHPATHTTPDPMQINSWIRKMVDAGCAYCFMEVSSHALSQHRVDGLTFKGGVFTNLTHDHLDYHKDFNAYLKAKKSFFDMLEEGAFALTNADDKNGKVMLQNTRASKLSYGLGRRADFNAKILEPHFGGMRLLVDEREVWVKLTGRFNASNILAVYGVCVLLDHDKTEILEAVSKADAAAGRFQVLRGAEGTVAVIDYAHTDDALKNVLEAIREVNLEGREIITVIGAGGDRDRAKRPKMGAVAASLSNKVILTSDNPRSEDPAMIMEEMENGIGQEQRGAILKIADREEAIKTACMIAGPESLVLVAGKGHEKTQEIRGEKKHFDDEEVITKYLK